MKKLLLIITISLTIISCSSSKKTTSRGSDNSSENSRNKVVNSEPGFSKEVNYKINTIIQSYLGVSMSSIARSEIKRTGNGYQWKFMNVKTGQNFTANSNSSFSTVKITKNSSSIISYN